LKIFGGAIAPLAPPLATAVSMTIALLNQSNNDSQLCEV